MRKIIQSVGKLKNSPKNSYTWKYQELQQHEWQDYRGFYIVYLDNNGNADVLFNGIVILLEKCSVLTLTHTIYFNSEIGHF